MTKSTNHLLTAKDYWTADQLQVMRGLELPHWFRPVLDQGIPIVTSTAEKSSDFEMEQLTKTPNTKTQDTVLDKDNTKMSTITINWIELFKIPALKNKQKDASVLNNSSIYKILIILGDSNINNINNISNIRNQQSEFLTDLETKLISNIIHAYVKYILKNSHHSHNIDTEVIAMPYLIKNNQTKQDNQLTELTLNQSIQRLNPSHIIVMGNVAAQQILEIDDDLNHLIEGNINGYDYNNKPLLILPHPASILENSALKAIVWQQLNYFKVY